MASFSMAGAAALLATGCQAPGPRPPGPPLDPAALVAQYPGVELSNAQVLADFQNTAQGAWFSVVSSVADSRFATEGASEAVEGGNETFEHADQPQATPPAIAAPPDGPDEARSLRFTLSSAADRLVCDLQRAAAAGAPRDWSEFGALLLRIWGPPDGTEVLLLLRGGGDAGFGEAAFPLRLGPGWNLLTVDLDAMSRGGERHDMRQVEIIPTLGSKPFTFFLDDLVLADRTQWSTSPGGAAEELYAYARGPRIFVGIRDRFELVFAEGAIDAWYARGLVNLAGRGGLGPWPALYANDWSGQADDYRRGLIIAGPCDLGVRPAAVQKVVEASATRVVLEAARELSLDGTGAEAAELRRCGTRYVIYPDGRVFVQTRLDAGPASWPLSRRGGVLLLDNEANFVVSDRPQATPDHEPASFALLTRTPPDNNLLWVPHDAAGMRWRRFVPETGPKPSVFLIGETPVEPVMSSAQLVWFCVESLDVAKAEELASDYQEPIALRPDAGTLVTDAPGDLNGDGYNESEGCYELALKRGRLRFRFDPGSVPREAPLFRIHGDENMRCWVYADGQALTAEARDGDGRTLFTIPGVIRSPRVVEIFTARESP